MKMNNFQPLTILAKSTILYVRLVAECAPIKTYVLMLHLWSPEYRRPDIQGKWYSARTKLIIEKGTLYDVGIATNGTHIR